MNIKRVMTLFLVLSSMRGVTAADEATAWLVVQPGYPGSTRDAEGFMRLFSSYLTERTSLGPLEGTYYNLPDDALHKLQARSPGFALVSLGFYLKYRQQFGFEVRLVSEPADVFLIVGRESEIQAAADLDGQEVVGGPLYEPGFLTRVVFRGRACVERWQARPMLRTSRALRRLARGRYKAVVLTGREFASLSRLSRGKKLEKVLQSDYYPAAVLVLIRPPKSKGSGSQGDSKSESEKSESDDVGDEPRKRTKKRTGRITTDPPAEVGGNRGLRAGAGQQVLTASQRTSLERAFLSMEEDLEAQDLLKTMGARGFKMVKPDWLKELEGQYDTVEKK